MGMTINLISKTNTYEESSHGYYDTPQGSTFSIIQIFEVLDGEKHIGFFKLTETLDSYGNADGETKISIVTPKTVQTTVWE